MTVSAAEAARALCEMREWRISNLEIQKILYLAQMYRLGFDPSTPLILEEFEAWDLGPVIPDLYHRLKAFGARPVRNVFNHVPAINPNSDDYLTLSQIEKITKTMSPGQLVANTHRSEGAWSRQYRPGVIGMPIPRSMIAQEAAIRGGRVA